MNYERFTGAYSVDVVSSFARNAVKLCPELMAATVFYSPLTVFRFVVCHLFEYGL